MMSYEKAELELIHFASEDVLSTSGDEETPETTGYGEDPVLPEDSLDGV